MNERNTIMIMIMTIKSNDIILIMTCSIILIIHILVVIILATVMKGKEGQQVKEMIRYDLNMTFYLTLIFFSVIISLISMLPY